ncbi:MULTISPECIES: hypothetical protein [Cytobacillus]|uniref:Uncharacterized protein n=1 Tax=Cytobacillus stercorigallinarum TaxID=2762240 RepID=A0ABR8QTW5_9BACI|nr:hypothetical protein [Cytobacillus stercorigallinarum]MBD7938938.1 hypothetical protein [Cytobacillus stercorigallinarum]
MKKGLIAVFASALIIGGGTFASANATNDLEIKTANFDSSKKVAEVEPEAIPAVAAAGFVGGVAFKAGTKATSWLLDKLGNNAEQPAVEYDKDLDVVFD